MAGGTLVGLSLSLSLSLPTAGGSGGGTKLWNSIGRVFEDYFEILCLREGRKEKFLAFEAEIGKLKSLRLRFSL